MSSEYKLISSTIDSVRAFYSAGNYAAAYRAIRDDLNSQNATARQSGLPPPIDADTIAWYSNAPEINDPNSAARRAD